MTRDSKIVAGVLLLVAAAAALYFALWRAPAAPEVTFVSLKGERIATSGLRGKVTLVQFWATDCVPCRKEMPELVRTYERYRGDGFELIAVAMHYDPPNFVLAYVDQQRLPFTVALDPMGRIAQAFGNVQVTPTLVVIGKDGRIVRQAQGEPDFAELRRLIERELATPA